MASSQLSKKTAVSDISSSKQAFIPQELDIPCLNIEWILDRSGHN